VKSGNINNQEERGDWRALRGAQRYRGESLGGTLEEEAAGPACEKGAGPGNQIGVDPFGTKHTAEGGGVD